MFETTSSNLYYFVIILILFQILRDSASNESAVHVHHKSSSQDRDYNLDCVVSTGNSNDFHTGMHVFSY